MLTRLRQVVVGAALVAGGLGAAPGTCTAAPPTHPFVLAKRVIGHSVQGRPIVAYHLGDPSIRRVSLVLGEMHGDEHAGVTLVRAIVHARRQLAGVNLWVVPTMNPDGDATHTRQNAHGVDLNRNWPYRWKRLSGEYYSGRRPLSEPESRAMHRFLLRLRPHWFVSLHQPLHAVDTVDGPRADRRFARRLARNLGLPHAPLRCWSVCHGSMTDWYVHHRYGLAQTVEFGWHPTHGYLIGRARLGILKTLGGHYLRR